jgi:hypothetical protein
MEILSFAKAGQLFNGSRKVCSSKSVEAQSPFETTPKIPLIHFLSVLPSFLPNRFRPAAEIIPKRMRKFKAQRGGLPE